MAQYKTAIKNATQLVVITSSGEKYKTGEDMNKVEIIEGGMMVIGQDGRIVAVGKTTDLESQYKEDSFDNVIDATGKSVVPGFVDGHTHPVWSGDRTHEFAMKLAGASYMDIHSKGGGIGFTVRHTQESSDEELYQLLIPRLNRMMKHGTTLVEGKSGYGLNCETEMKMLRVLHRGNQEHPVDIVSTFLGAHSVPKGSTLDTYTEEILNEHIPKLKELKAKGEISPEFIDVFHEKGVFETPQTERILKAGAEAGLGINFHGDELNAMDSGVLGAKVGATAISHLEEVTKEEMDEMQKAEITAVLLPTTAYILRLTPPPARELIKRNVIVSIASDFNPNAHCMSMPFVMNLSCVLMRMTMNEALVAATLNAAASLKKSQDYGSLEPGKYGDCVIVDGALWEHIIYELADPPIHAVVKKGEVVHQK